VAASGTTNAISYRRRARRPDRAKAADEDVVASSADIRARKRVSRISAIPIETTRGRAASVTDSGSAS